MATHWLTLDQQRAWRTYLVGTTRLHTHLDQVLRERHGLTLSQYEILSRLSEANGHTLRMADLAVSVENSRSRMSRSISRLESERLVRREHCGADGRGVNAVLTEAGLQKVVAAAPDHVESVRAGLVDLADPEDLKAVERVFAAVITALRD